MLKRKIFIRYGRARSVKFGTLVEKAGASSSLLLLLLLLPHQTYAVTISSAEAERIGRRIWQNECGGTISGLTSWNAGENFASLGIGHFIWYPENEGGPFEESFPKLVRFVLAHGATVPAFAIGRSCPWNSRSEFKTAQDSPQMTELRRFLATTILLQTQFVVERLHDSLPQMLAQSRDPENVRRQFERVGATSQGCYALVDYVNFKGEGTLSTERYRGQGWGLLQVLEDMHGIDQRSAVNEFVASAKAVLRRRVANSPLERHENRWLSGWLARVESYRARS
jgi:hypothetical protein